MSLENLSRRSFLKKTTVLTVGVTSMTLFSGLVNAEEGSGYECSTKINSSSWHVNVADPESPGNLRGLCYKKFTCKDINGNELGEFRTNGTTCATISCAGNYGDISDFNLPVCD